MKKILQEEYLLIKRPSVVCKDCKKRNPGCHSDCQDYISFKKELDEYNSKRKEEADIESLYWNYKKNKLFRRR